MSSGPIPRIGEDYLIKIGWHLSSQQGCVLTSCLVTTINFCFLFPGMCIHFSFLNLCNCINDTVPQFVKCRLRRLRQIDLFPSIHPFSSAYLRLRGQQLDLPFPPGHPPPPALWGGPEAFPGQPCNICLNYLNWPTTIPHHRSQI